MNGILYIISAPSGTGKSSLIHALLKNNLLSNTYISVSYTTRAIRKEEINGEHYFFVTQTEFKKMIEKNIFLEYAKVFGHYYGTSRVIIEQILANGIDVILDIDWQGAQQIRNKILDTLSIFILPPSKKELYYRLLMRGQDQEEVIKKRMAQAVTEITHYIEYDYLIINNDYNTALIDLTNIICAERLRIKNQQYRYETLINQLMMTD